MIIDLSRRVEEGMPVYPGDTQTVLAQTSSVPQDGYTNHLLTINMHAGTHIDGPMHLLDCNVYLDEFPIESFIGDGCLLDATGQPDVDYDERYETLIPEGSIVVVHTGHGEFYGQSDYFTQYPSLTEAFAELLIRKRVKMVVLDTPSPDYSPFAIHKLLFRNRVLIAENAVNTERLLGAGAFEVTALPLHIRADSSPARIVARLKS
ncbi:cyclase family protein [Paenibacillus sp. NPDC058071]|uniref:cyclase family protein n=1 Tax=Paenibacillus sp. NPDC058071 TaxID=3346326 RepID=UPI0036DF01A0